ncbi:hypothetical protein [Glutamicibacter creatinolyticus]|uniref:hypothetical protein n=1 Tax=Glutamicibacter creatinolyticus TaxID=162496 RepID=UPI0032163BC9
MTILGLLETHTVKRPWSEASRMRCKCGEVVTAETEGQLYALHRAHVAEVLETHQQEREAQLRQLVRDMTDPDPCWFDHHGGCQAHGYLELKPGELCPHDEAKQLLKEQP